MLWCITKEGTNVVHDTEGNWIGTFKDAQTAVEVFKLHNRTLEEHSLDAKRYIAGSVGNGWGKTASWK